jgi:hypothetical protein
MTELGLGIREADGLEFNAASPHDAPRCEPEIRMRAGGSASLKRELHVVRRTKQHDLRRSEFRPRRPNVSVVA